MKTKLTAPEILGKLLTPKQAAEAQGISLGYLGDTRRSGGLIEGIHYRLIGGRSRYSALAIDHYFANLGEPEVHRKWIEKKIRELNQQDC